MTDTNVLNMNVIKFINKLAVWHMGGTVTHGDSKQQESFYIYLVRHLSVSYRFVFHLLFSLAVFC